MSGTRWILLVLLVGLAIVTLLPMAELVEAGIAPMVTRPSGTGPYEQGWVDGVINTSTKSYDTPVRYYYPATSSGRGATPDPSDAPYPCILWLPGFGGPYNSYVYEANHLTSHGMIVVTIGVNWNDFLNSANRADLEDILDHLESLNATPGDPLYQMVDKEAYGISGHSSGGGLSLANGAFVDRIKAVQTFAAAIGTGSVDAIAPYYDKPLMLQVGQQDSSYIAGSRRAYEKIGYTNSLIEIIGGGHGGPFQMHLYAAFYLYHLDHQDEYYTFLYGPEAVADAASGLADVYFKASDDHFFPPTITASISATSVLMDEPVDLNATISGYQRPDDPLLVHEWDLNGDHVPEVSSGTGPNVTYTFDRPGVFYAVYTYSLGAFNLRSDPVRITVANVPPVAVAGADIQVDHDSAGELDGKASHDTPSDNLSLLYRWDFSDGQSTNVTSNSRVSRLFSEVGVVVATLTVIDSYGNVSTDTVNITVVNVAPTADALSNITAFEDESVRFQGAGYDTVSHVDALKFMWEFGDGISSDWSPNPEMFHPFSKEGEYDATLWVKDPEGELASDNIVVTVINKAPVGVISAPLEDASFWKDDVVEFQAQAHDTPSDIDRLTFRWDFGDGEVTEWLVWKKADLTHIYTSSGEFTITLEVKDDDDDVSTISVGIVVVNAEPVATVIKPWPSTTVDEDSPVPFVGRGADTPSDGQTLTFQWVVDEVSHAGEEHTHTFTDEGTYIVTFVVTDWEGAMDSLDVTVTVVNVAPELEAQMGPLTVEEGDEVTFTATGIDTTSDQEGLVFSWDLGDGTVVDEANGVHGFQSFGTYKVTVTVTDDDGAEDALTFTVVVLEPIIIDPPPSDPDGDDGTPDDGTSWLLYGGLAALAVVVLMIVLWMLVLRGGSPEGAGDVPSDDDIDYDLLELDDAVEEEVGPPEDGDEPSS
ncbi:MAG: PKD domain-containing protein [Thermoplasmata archaeon]|nr:PKD domain-containing protein [Thermoplasmata archaeon]